jgi:hypothetical protein
MPPDYDADPEIERALIAGQKVLAVKRYRELTGASLSDALAAVNAAQRRLVNAGRIDPSALRPRPGRSIALILLGSALAFAALIYHFIAGIPAGR